MFAAGMVMMSVYRRAAENIVVVTAVAHDDGQPIGVRFDHVARRHQSSQQEEREQHEPNGLACAAREHVLNQFPDELIFLRRCKYS